MDYVITKEELNKLLHIAGETPAKFSFTTIQILNNIIARAESINSDADVKEGDAAYDVKTG